MRAYVVAAALVILVAGCKGDEKGTPAGEGAGSRTPPTGKVSGPAPKGGKSPASGAPSAQVDCKAPPTGKASGGESGSKTPPTVEPDVAVVIIDRAIAATGGLAAIKEKFAAYTVVSRGLYLGTPYEMTTAWVAPDRMVMVLSTGGMTMGYVGTECWNTLDGVVVDCLPEEAKTLPMSFYLARLEGLYILKEPGYRFEMREPGEVSGRATDVLRVTHPDAPVPVDMEFYRDTGLLARTRYDGSFGGTEGPVIHDILTYREVDGVQFPRKSLVTAGGKRFVDDMTMSVSWGADAALFARPAQRPLGVPAVRTLPDRVVAFVVHKGPYEELGGVLGELMAWATSAGLDIMGPPTFVYLTAPGQVADPAGPVTEIRVPVTASRDLTAQHAVYALKPLEETLVVTQLEQGPYEKAGAAFGPLAAWCGENGYEMVGPPMMTGYSDPTATPPDALLNELLWPVRKTD